MNEEKKYRICVSEMRPSDNKFIKFNYEIIYEQTVESLNLQAVIAAVNHPEHTDWLHNPEKKDE